jgi:trimeric autotransporter adhesin
MKHNTTPLINVIRFTERPLVTAVRQAIPYVLCFGMGLSGVHTSYGRTSDSAAAFSATQLVRQFTLKNTVAQVRQGLQGYVQNGTLAPPMDPGTAGFPSDMGSVPASANLPRRDGAGRPLGYCAWDSTATISSATYNAGPATGGLVYAVASPGLNGSMETSCADILARHIGLVQPLGAGDDYVEIAAPTSVSSASYKGSVSTFADLPAGEDGDIRLVRDTNKLYSYVSGSWQPVQAGPFDTDVSGNISYTTGKVTVADFQATTATLTGALSGTTATFSGAVAANTFTGNGSGLTDLNASNFTSGVVSAQFGGTGVNGAAAANGALLIGNGSGYTLGTLTAGAGIGVVNGAGAITISNTGVLSITGTADQIIASAGNGNVVLSLPQAIATTSTPTFGGLMLNGSLMGTTATFGGAVTVDSLSASRLNIGTSAGGVTNPNLIVGNSAMPGVQSGNGGNTALGINTLNANTSGQLNTATGLSALMLNTTGSFNTASGFQTLVNNTTGYSNSAFGTNALLNNTTGYNNAALGTSAGVANTTGNNNTFLGATADAVSGALTYATAIGSDSRVATSNTLALGRNSTLDQVVIGTDSRNDTFANTKLYVNGVTYLNGDLRGTTATFSGNVDLASISQAGLPATLAFRYASDTGDVAYNQPSIGLGAGALAGQKRAGNVAIGDGVLGQLTTSATAWAGSQNVGVGQTSLFSNTTGYDNVAVGFSALYSNTSGYSNVAIGEDALFFNTTGTANVAIGEDALFFNTTGSRNIAIGEDALRSNTTGFTNLAIGEDSLLSNTTGTYNVATGGVSLTSNTIGSSNVASGFNSMRFNTTGNENVSVGRAALYNNTSGSQNTALGRQAGFANTTGSNNTLVGAMADVSTDALIYATAIGSDSRVATSNTLALGRNSTLDQVVIGTDSRNDTYANTKLYVNGVTYLNGDLRGTTATFTGAVTMDTLSLQRLNIGTSAGGVTVPNVIIGNGAMPLAQSGYGSNIAVGISALASNTTGYDNAALGAYALRDNTTGVWNTAVGSGALLYNTTGYENTGLGAYALWANTTGVYNTAVGSAALTYNTTGYDNTGVGTQALRANTTGIRNTAVGSQALQVSTTGYDNAALGAFALNANTTGVYNTAVGSEALGNNTTGYDNTALGKQSLFSNTTGVFNTAVGSNALQDNTTGFYNVGLGVAALGDNTTGASNTAVGKDALRYNTTGFNNTGLGVVALRANTTGIYNTAVGTNALVLNTTGSSNLALGRSSGATNVTGSNNTFLGSMADATGSAGSALTYATAIGAGSTVATSNTLALGRNSTADQVVIGTDTRNDAIANTKLYVNGVTNLNGDLRGTTATFSGAVSFSSLSSQRIDVGTNTGVTNPNVIIGASAMPLAQSGTGANTAVGHTALNQNLSGAFNTAVGRNTLRDTTSGSSNTAVGAGAMLENETGNMNTSVGVSTLRNNISGNDNTAVGYLALSSNTTGQFNVAMGSVAMLDNLGGSYSVAVGYDSMRRNTSGIKNTALGEQALYVNLTGNFNTAIGNSADVVATNLNYASAVGAHAKVNSSDTLVLGTLGASKNATYSTTDDQVVIGTTARSGTHKLWVQGTAVVTGGVTTSSDRLLKTNINQLDVDSMLTKLGQFGAYRYNYIGNPEAGTKIGVIAQELQALFPEVANYGNGDRFLSVDYSALGAMAAVGVGQLNNKFIGLDKKVTEHGEKLVELGGKVEQNSTRIGALESWKTDAIARMDGMQTAIDLNIQKIADNAVAIQTNAKAIERLDDALLTLDSTVKGNTEAIGNINARWARNFSASEDGSLLTVNAVELKVSNFSAQQVKANSLYTERLEAEMARIAELEVNNLRVTNTVQAGQVNTGAVRAEEVNTGSVQVYAGVGMPALLFAAKADGHYTVSTSALDGSYAAALVIVNAGQAKVIPLSGDGIELIAEGNMVKVIAAGKSIKASWTKTG